MTDKFLKQSAKGINLRAATCKAPTERDAPLSRIKIERSEFPDPPSGQNGPAATIENVDWLIGRYGIIVRYNVIKKKVEVIIPGLGGTTDNHDNNALTHIISIAARHGMATGAIPAIIDALADHNLFNPVADWIVSEPWDGDDRLPAMCATLETVEDYPPDLRQVLVTKWLLSAVAAALMPSGFRARGVLTLQGAQGLGKTSWCRSLIPDPALREIAIKLDHHLDGANKDSILGAVSHWICEIGELDSSFRRDIARLKGFLTNDRDKVRRPYARIEAEYGRRTVFMATVNQSDFLVDHTGNSRWWTLPVVKIDYDHGINTQQVFAQLAVRLEVGDQWWLTPEEEQQLEAWNSRHRSFSLVEDAISSVVDWDQTDPAAVKALTPTDLLAKTDLRYCSNPQAKECAAILREHLGEPKRINGRMKWRVPLRTDASADDAAEPTRPTRRFD
ncbi:VapE domain-containing protein [Novosphingobium aquae]|uniref:VapE domain-containing protein n=1 Tax=Novosphingobium aquae TaxID=3133435 RepID=A0ABU8SC23_9SPHN